MVTIYDKKGVAHQRESVDARECVASGEFTLDDPKAVKAAKDADAAAKAEADAKAAAAKGSKKDDDKK